MGNREDLARAAGTLVRSKRFGSISARDLAGEAGSSTAAINYHFGTLDRLLLSALIDAMTELGSDVDRALAVAAADSSDTSPTARQRAFWDAIISSVTTDRPLWLANFEALLESESRPDLKRLLAESSEFGARAIDETLYGAESESAKHAPPRGRLVNALMVGLVVQHLIDPDAAPDAQQVADWLSESDSRSITEP